MAPKIVDKIRELNAFIETNAENDEGLARALEIQDMAAKAIDKGMQSQEWEDYMKLFATTPDQLRRLKGLDSMRTDKPWGLNALVYLVANGVCTMGSRANTVRFMDAEMIAGLDDFGNGDTSA